MSLHQEYCFGKGCNIAAFSIRLSSSYSFISRLRLALKDPKVWVRTTVSLISLHCKNVVHSLLSKPTSESASSLSPTEVSASYDMQPQTLLLASLATFGLLLRGTVATFACESGNNHNQFDSCHHKTNNRACSHDDKHVVSRDLDSSQLCLHPRSISSGRVLASQAGLGLHIAFF